MMDVIGIYTDKAHVDVGVERLLESGFTKDEISVLLIDPPTDIDLVHQGHSTAAVTSGMALGGTLGFVAGFAAMAIPGLESVRAAGPFLGAIAGTGVGGTIGGLISQFYGIGVPAQTVEEYEAEVASGKVLVTVHCETAEKLNLAKEVLLTTEARNVSQTDKAPDPDHSHETVPEGESPAE